MCTKNQIPAHKISDGYDFSGIFFGCKDFFSSSDYVIGNLETPIANAKYCNHLINYNSPDSFAKAVKDCGIDMVTTANNHCLDRGESGLEDTINALDSIGLKHTGTNLKNILPTGIIENFGEIKTGFLSYTYGTNARFNKCFLNENEKWKVNLLREQETRKGNDSLFLKRMEEDIKALKKEGADFLIMFLHTGGQYSPFPLKKTKRLADLIANMGVDAVIANHEHVIHNIEIKNDKIFAYSLGNFSSLFCVQSAPFIKLSDYSVLVNLYLSKNKNGDVKMSDATFAIAKTVKDGKNRVKTVLLYDLINQCCNKNEKNKLTKDNLKIHNRVSSRKEAKIELKREYSLKNSFTNM
ncbi:MAG: CapA family protein [Treponema sp.]|nr:CapA family protein [Treponema sp.]MCL2236754.1 CapA family protein [Treponema sp.]